MGATARALPFDPADSVGEVLTAQPAIAATETMTEMIDPRFGGSLREKQRA